MNPLIVTEKTSLKAAMAMLETYRTEFKHVFWPDSLSVSETLPMVKPFSAHRQITDVYLLSLAIAHKGRPVSFDGGITTLVPEKHRGNVVIVESQAACSDSLLKTAGPPIWREGPAADCRSDQARATTPQPWLFQLGKCPVSRSGYRQLPTNLSGRHNRSTADQAG